MNVIKELGMKFANTLLGLLVFIVLIVIGYGMTLIAIGGALWIVPFVALGKTVEVFSK